MSRTSSIARLSNTILSSPLIWGGLACLGFYAVLGQSTLNNPLVGRYFESHPVEYITTALFFVGLAALVKKVLEIAVQSLGVAHPLVAAVPDGGQAIDDAPNLLAQLDDAPASLKRGYLFRRLHEALEFVRRRGTADSLDDQLRYLADEDIGRMQTSYAFVRIVIWAIPILGFLGTVIGITLAIGKLSPQQLDESLPAVMSGLSVAFDTTALALSLSILLMFAKFFVEQLETGLLIHVDARVNKELIGRFQQHGAMNDPNVALIRRSADTVIAAADELTKRQAEIWKETIDAAHQRWMSLTTTAGEVVETALAEAVAGSIERHAAVLENGLEHHATELLEGMARQATVIAESTELLISSVAESTSQLSTSLADSTEQLASSVTENTSQLSTTLANSTEQLASSVSESTSQLSNSLADSTEQFASSVTESTSQLSTSLADSTQQHTAGLGECLRATMTELTQVIARHRESLSDGTERLIASASDGLAKHCEAVLAGEQALAEENRRHLSEVQLAIVEAAAQGIEQQEQLVRQGDVLLKVVDATGQVRRLEETLNHNLAALAGSHNFEQTVTSLAAAIQLLSMQLDHVGVNPATVQLETTDSQPPAAA